MQSRSIVNFGREHHCRTLGGNIIRSPRNIMFYWIMFCGQISGKKQKIKRDSLVRAALFCFVVVLCHPRRAPGSLDRSQHNRRAVNDEEMLTD